MALGEDLIPGNCPGLSSSTYKATKATMGSHPHEVSNPSSLIVTPPLDSFSLLLWWVRILTHDLGEGTYSSIAETLVSSGSTK